MKYRPYPKYKPSGIEWLGDVPEHWDVKRLRYLATINDEALPETTDPSYEFTYVDIGSVHAVRGIEATERMEFDNAPSRARRIVRDGDTIVSTVRTYLRAIAPIRAPEENLIVSTGFAVVRPRSVDPNFLSYALRESRFVETVVAYSVGVSYPAVNASDVSTIPIPLPSIPEQRAIAEFLNAGTAMLDKLVVNKRKLIEKLKEKRTALISRTVTRDLQPEAARTVHLAPHSKLKPTGIAWLGDVPKHWTVTPTKYLAVGGTRNGIYKPPSDFVEDGVPMVQMSEAFAGPILATVAKDRVRLSKTELLDWALLEGDLLFGRRSLVFSGSGKCVLVGRLPEPHVFESSLIRVRPNRKIAEPKYLFYFFGSAYGRAQVLSATKQVTISGVDSQQIKAVLVVLPPLLEQRAIAGYLDRETAKIDRMVQKVEAAIERLQEYRSALITAAVTGKIDVREAGAKL